VTGSIKLARPKKLHYAGLAASGGSPLARFRLFQSHSGSRLPKVAYDAQKHSGATRSGSSAEVAFDRLQRHKNYTRERAIESQAAELQKENGQVGNDLETMTAAQDALTNENEKLKAEIKNLKTGTSRKRASSRKHRGS
jgi:hypothetical protein